MKKYCFNCGSKLEFSVREKPKFCAQCGSPLDPSSNACDEGEEISETRVPARNLSISELDFEFDITSLKAKGEPIESLIGTLDKVSEQKLPGSPAPSKEETLEQYKQEAGTLRVNKHSEEDA